jgi:hypothetical protein
MINYLRGSSEITSFLFEKIGAKQAQNQRAFQRVVRCFEIPLPGEFPVRRYFSGHLAGRIFLVGPNTTHRSDDRLSGKGNIFVSLWGEEEVSVLTARMVHFTRRDRTQEENLKISN